MKWCFILTISIGFAWTQQPEAAGPKLTVANPVFNFGEIDKGEKVTTEYTFTNTGGKPLEIQNISTSCGCTSATPEKKIYQPGESGSISVTFDSTRFNGPITKRVTIHSNDRDTPQTLLTIKGLVVVDIKVSSASLFFADARIGEKTSQEMVVSTDKLETLALSNVAISPDFLSVAVTQTDEKRTTLTITADGTKFPEGKTRLNGALTFDTNSETQPNIRSIVTVHIQRLVNVAPNSAYFFASKLGEAREMTVKLSATGEEPFTIKNISSDLDFIDVSIAEDQPTQKALKVVLSESAIEGKFKGEIAVELDLPAQPKINIMVRGSVVR